MDQQPLPDDLYQEFLQLASAMSPENLTCDGLLSRREVKAKAEQLRSAWRKLESKAGRAVTEDEVWRQEVGREEEERRAKEGAFHTPGSWAVNHSRRSVHHLQYDEPLDDRNEICRMPNGNPESLANARLIAAAPALLRSLKELLWQHDHNNGRLCGMALQDARAVVAGVPGEGEGPMVQEEASDEGMKV